MTTTKQALKESLAKNPQTLREAIKYGIEDGKAEGNRLAGQKKAKLSEAERVAREKKTFRVIRWIAFFVGTGLFVATALFAVSVGVWVWLAWVWAVVFWLKWQHKIAKNSKIQRDEWEARLAV